MENLADWNSSLELIDFDKTSVCEFQGCDAREERVPAKCLLDMTTFMPLIDTANDNVGNEEPSDEDVTNEDAANDEDVVFFAPVTDDVDRKDVETKIATEEIAYENANSDDAPHEKAQNEYVVTFTPVSVDIATEDALNEEVTNTDATKEDGLNVVRFSSVSADFVTGNEMIEDAVSDETFSIDVVTVDAASDGSIGLISFDTTSLIGNDTVGNDVAHVVNGVIADVVNGDAENNDNANAVTDTVADVDSGDSADVLPDLVDEKVSVCPTTGVVNGDSPDVVIGDSIGNVSAETDVVADGVSSVSAHVATDDVDEEISVGPAGVVDGDASNVVSGESIGNVNGESADVVTETTEDVVTETTEDVVTETAGDVVIESVEDVASKSNHDDSISLKLVALEKEKSALAHRLGFVLNQAKKYEKALQSTNEGREKLEHELFEAREETFTLRAEVTECLEQHRVTKNELKTERTRAENIVGQWKFYRHQCKKSEKTNRKIVEQIDELLEDEPSIDVLRDFIFNLRNQLDPDEDEDDSTQNVAEEHNETNKLNNIDAEVAVNSDLSKLDLLGSSASG